LIFDEYIMTAITSEVTAGMNTGMNGGACVFRHIGSAFGDGAATTAAPSQKWSMVCKSDHFTTQIASGVVLHVIPTRVRITGSVL
jgi:hypothetical protein